MDVGKSKGSGLEEEEKSERASFSSVEKCRLCRLNCVNQSQPVPHTTKIPEARNQ